MTLIKKIYILLVGIGGLALMLWFILPSVYISFTYIPVAICSALLAALVYLGDRKRFSKYASIYLLCLLLSVLYLIIPYSLQLKPAVNIFQQMVIYTAPVMLATFFVSLDRNRKFNRRMYWLAVIFIIGCMSFVYVRTMSELAVNPTVCRLLAVGNYNEYRAEEIRELRMSNVGGFGFSYAIGLIETLCFYTALKEKKAKRVIFILITAALLIFIVKSQYLTLLFLCIIINLVISFRFQKNDISRVLIISAIIILLIFASPIIRYLSQMITGEKLSEKMYAISGLLQGDGYSSMRLDYIKDAFVAFGHHIFLGQPDLINKSDISAISSHVHSTQIKLLVDVGLVGSFVYNFFLFYIRNFVARLIKRNGHNPEPFMMAFWFFWLLSWFNPVFENYEIPFALFFAIPVLSSIPKSDSNTLQTSK